MSFDLFNSIKDNVLSIDPVNWAEKYLNLDGKNFRLNGNGYKPLVDIYRQIGIKALERENSKPIIICKGRQIGMTTASCVLELYFLASGLFGNNGKPPMRILHCFPQLEIAYKYTKTKFNSMLKSSVNLEDVNSLIKVRNKNPGKKTSYIESKLDPGTSESMGFKQFVGGNQIFIDSTGFDGDRLRGMTVDQIYFDECFPYEQYIETEIGRIMIGDLYTMWKNDCKLPKVKSYNEITKKIEYKKIINAWDRGVRNLFKINSENKSISCTDNHKFLTTTGWKEARYLTQNDLILTSLGPSFKVDSINETSEYDNVYDIEVEDNHNFVLDERLGGPIAHNCQDMRRSAIGNTIKSLNKSQYGKVGDGVQVYFGTPKRKGSDFWKMWQDSSMQYFYLGCEECKEYFPLYTPGTDDWEKIWIEDNLPSDDKRHGFIVKCTKCGCEQDKREAAERGKWISLNPESNSKYIGYHLNQLYMPEFNREKVMSEKPGIHPINTERTYQNEVLGEFHSGDSSPITSDEIDANCADLDRKFTKHILPTEDRKVYLGCDWGAKVDMEQNTEDGESSGGRSYSCAVVLTAENQHITSIDFCTRLKKNTLDYKIETIEELYNRYNVTLGIGDIGFANDLTELLQKKFGDKFLASRSSAKVNGKYKFDEDIFPKTILFEKDYLLSDIFDMLKNGKIRFPYKDYEKVAWLVEHCCSMEIRATMTNAGDISYKFIKGATPNDGLMALANAILAFKYDLTNGFKDNPNLTSKKPEKKPIPAVLGYIPRHNVFNRGNGGGNNY